MKRRIEMFEKKSETIGHEQAALKFALTDTNLDLGTFKGIASVFGSMVDAWMPTVIEPGAFTQTLRAQAGRIKLLWQHDPSEPIGIPLSLQETPQGLELMGKISQTERGRDCLTLMRDGVITELSIGFDPIKWEMEDKGDGQIIRHVKEVKLWEISAVTFAADASAKIQSVHERSDKKKKAAKSHKCTTHQMPMPDDTADVVDPEDCLDSCVTTCQDCSADMEEMAGDCTECAQTCGTMITAGKIDLAALGRMQAMMENCAETATECQGELDACAAECQACINTMPEDEGDQTGLYSLETILEHLARVPREAYEGKVLSAKNKKLLEDALAALQALLSAAEPLADSTVDGKKPPQGTVKQALDAAGETNQKPDMKKMAGTMKLAKQSLQIAIDTHAEHLSDPNLITTGRQKKIAQGMVKANAGMDKAMGMMGEGQRRGAAAEPLAARQALTVNAEQLKQLASLQMWQAGHIH